MSTTYSKPIIVEIPSQPKSGDCDCARGSGAGI